MVAMSFDHASRSVHVTEDDLQVSNGYHIEARVTLPRQQRIEAALVLWENRIRAAISPLQAALDRTVARVPDVRILMSVPHSLLVIELALAQLVHAAATARPLTDREADLVEAAAQGDWRSVQAEVRSAGRTLDVLITALLRVGLLPRSTSRDPRAIPVLATRLYHWTAGFCEASQPRAALCSAIRACGAALRRWGEAGTSGWDQPTPSLDRLCGPADADRLVDVIANVELKSVPAIPGTAIYACSLSAPLGLVISCSEAKRRRRSTYHVSIIDWDGGVYSAMIGTAAAGMTAQAATEIFSLIGHDAEELLDGYAGGPSTDSIDATTRARNQLGDWILSPSAA